MLIKYEAIFGSQTMLTIKLKVNNVKNKNLIFGSCLNYIISLKKQKFKINYYKLENYLKFGFRTLNIQNESLLKNVFSIEPGSFIVVDKFLKIKKIEIIFIINWKFINFTIIKF